MLQCLRTIRSTGLALPYLEVALVLQAADMTLQANVRQAHRFRISWVRCAPARANRDRKPQTASRHARGARKTAALTRVCLSFLRAERTCVSVPAQMEDVMRYKERLANDKGISDPQAVPQAQRLSPGFCYLDLNVALMRGADASPSADSGALRESGSGSGSTQGWQQVFPPGPI